MAKYERDIYKEFEKGEYAIIREDAYDSYSERACSVYLQHIIDRYQLGEKAMTKTARPFVTLRLNTQVALDNYATLDEAKMREKDQGRIYDEYFPKLKWMRLDFVLEEFYEGKVYINRKPVNEMIARPVLVVEVDGPDHNTEEQKSRDGYKAGVMAKKGAHLERIVLEESKIDFFDEEQFLSRYEKTLVKGIILGICKSRKKRFPKQWDGYDCDGIKKIHRDIENHRKKFLKGDPKEEEMYQNMMAALSDVIHDVCNLN